MEFLISLFQWLKISFITIFIAILFCLLLRHLKLKHLIMKVLGVYMLINAWVILYICYRIDGGNALYYALPLHVCSLVILLSGISIFYRPQILLELVFYFGIIGGMLALCFPVYVHERSGYLFWDYFIGHALMPVIVVYHLICGFKPRKNSAFRCYCVFVICAGVIFLFNVIFGTNYWYINGDPGFRTAIFSSIWPYYLIEWFFIGMIFVFLLERPFKKYH